MSWSTTSYWMGRSWRMRFSSHDTLHNLCASVQAETEFGQPQFVISFSTNTYAPTSLANIPLRRFFMTSRPSRAKTSQRRECAARCIHPTRARGIPYIGKRHPDTTCLSKRRRHYLVRSKGALDKRRYAPPRGSEGPALESLHRHFRARALHE